MPRRLSGDVGTKFRRRLQSLLNERGMTPEDLDRAAGLAYAHTAKLLAGRIRYPELPTLALICWALNLESVDELAPVEEIVAEIIVHRRHQREARKKAAR